jgi:cation:H+ antiporter
MNLSAELLIFAAWLALNIIASIVLLQELDRIGARLRLSEGLLGLLAALGANAPEISASVAAMRAHEQDIGLGVVLGASIFNLAALLGLSAVVSGIVRISRPGLILNGVVAIAVALIGLAIVLQWIGAALALVVLICILAPYVTLFSVRSSFWKRGDDPPSPVGRFILAAVTHAQEDARHDQSARHGSWLDALSILPALVSIVLSSTGMVHLASAMGERWHVSHDVIGTLVLAVLATIPNVITAVRLALHHRGSAVVSESLNSNSLNVLAGICLPVLALSIGSPSAMNVMAAWWLLAMTVLAVVLTAIGGGLRRWEGAILIAIYIVFATITIVRG